MKPLISLCAACAATALLGACGKRDESHENPSAAMPAHAPSNTMSAEPAAPMGATVQLMPTKGNRATGTLSLNADGGMVRLTGQLEGLKPNAEFGFHIHEKGDCSAEDASSAGGHFNPANAQHGNPAGDAHHAGDMLNVKSDDQGSAQVDAQASGVTLGDGQPTDIAGKAVVLHEKADDYKSQPAGDSGARIACGVIAGG